MTYTNTEYVLYVLEHGIRIYILYNYELYKLTIKIYVQKYYSVFFIKKMFLMVQKDLLLIFTIIIKIYTIKTVLELC